MTLPASRAMQALRCMFVTLLALLWQTPGWADALPPPGGAHHLAMRLVAESDTPRAGGTVTLALDTRPQPGWHGYWSNPGDAGFPATLSWTLPKGASVSEPRYPLPGQLVVAGLMNYVYRAPYAPLLTLTVPAGFASGTTLPIRLHANYLVCTDSLCVPEQTDLALDLTVGDGAITPARQAQFDAWRQALPRPLGSAATWQRVGDQLRVAVPYPAGAPLADAHLYPLTTGFIDNAAPQTITRDGDRLLVSTKTTGGSGRFAAVLQVAPGQGLELAAAPGVVPAGSAASGSRSVLTTTLLALGGAILGGLILNIMPCVFPILSIKALSLARAHDSEAHARAEALAYTAGVVLVCVGLGAAILGLRAGGAAVGWAFQLQDARVVALLLLLVAAIAFNLAGLFELPTPRFAGQSGAAGAFASGALAAFIATPCTGPFMAAALGAALVLPAAAALAVFAGLGLGLALPFLAIGFIPALRRKLPKPGAWMETFRHILSVPMFLTALALAWVLGKLAGVNAMSVGLLAVIGVGLVLWVAGRRQARGKAFGAAALVALLLVAVGTPVGVTRVAAQPGVVTASAGEEPFSETRLAALRAQHRPVFAYFTADWCLTCKVNERGAIDPARAALARKNVAVLVGDWTSGDPVLGRFIEAHNRAGVPLYLYYPAGATEPQVLPQVLTPGLLEGLS